MGSGTSADFPYGRIVKMAWLTLVMAVGLALTAPAMAIADSAQFSIAAQPLPQALKAFAAQAHMQLLYEYGAVAHAKGNAVVGDLDKHAALEQLLKDSGLEAVYSSDTAATIRRVSATPASPRSRTTEQSQDSQSGSRLQLAQATSGQTAGAAPVEQQPSSETKPEYLQEVIVTAQKREERLLDVPVPVTAVFADALVEQNQLRLQDYYTQIPGINVTPDAAGQPTVIIRGLSTGVGVGNPTVGITVDDVPFGSSSALGTGGDVPDIDPGQLQRVEVLRGPQGTLYGASSLGGLIKFVTSNPSTTIESGRVEVGTNAVYNGDKAGYNVRASGNLPLGDTWGVSASAFTRMDPGYIDDPGLHARGVNQEDASGGRVAVLWAPSAQFSLKLGALIEKNDLKGSPDTYFLPNLGDLQQSDQILGLGGYTDQLQAYSAVMRANLGSIDLTSVTGYNVKKLTTSIDISSLFATFTQPQFNVGGTAETVETDDRKFSQEIRLNSPLGSRVDGLLGLFYTHERVNPYENDIVAVNTDTGQTAGYWTQNTGLATYQEYAVFADITIKFTSQFDVQLGGRESHNDQSYSERDFGPYGTVLLGLPSELFILPEVRTNDSSFTYLITPQFKLTSDIMLYVRVASGYRAGGPNAGCSVYNVPCSFQPDTSRNYELGTKASLFDRRLIIDASAYYIDWHDIQISVYDQANFNNYIANGSRAKSEGLELSADSRPIESLKLSAWLAWNEAVLTEGFPSNSNVVGVEGDRLPNSSKISGSFTAEDDFQMGTGFGAYLAGSVSYVGDRAGPFVGSTLSSSQRPDLGGYATVSARGGLRRDSWQINLFINNVTDRRGILSTGPFSYQYQYIQPRTVGVSLSKTF